MRMVMMYVIVISTMNLKSMILSVEEMKNVFKKVISQILNLVLNQQ